MVASVIHLPAAVMGSKLERQLRKAGLFVLCKRRDSRGFTFHPPLADSLRTLPAERCHHSNTKHTWHSTCPKPNRSWRMPSLQKACLASLRLSLVHRFPLRIQPKQELQPQRFSTARTRRWERQQSSGLERLQTNPMSNNLTFFQQAPSCQIRAGKLSPVLLILLVWSVTLFSKLSLFRSNTVQSSSNWHV